ncbi:MAG: hypothetical protein E7211_20620 [Clostridium lundense]|nr:hypothetical protein [Clostridium lundense]
MKSNTTLFKHFILFGIGAFLYLLIEILYRGHTHWTMGILGGICFVLVGLINEYLSWDMPLCFQGIIGAVIITVLEFVSGLILNIWLGLDIWDYSQEPFNFMGQICLSFSAVWIGLSVMATILDDWLRCWLFGEERPHYRLF